MLSKICIYNNKIFFALDCYLIAYCHQKYPKSENEKFFECFKIRLPVKCTSVLDTKLDVIENYITGLKSLLIILFELTGHCSIFIYNNASRKKLQQILLPSFSARIGDSLFISNGPNFLLHSKEAFEVYSLTHCVNNYFDFRHHLPGCKEFKILQFKCFGPFRSSYQQYLLLVILSCNISSQQSLKILTYIPDKSNPLAPFGLLRLNLFFPDCYETILKAVEVTKISPLLKCGLINIEDLNLNETASLICTKDECLIFSNANLLYCCKLTVPLTNIMYMKVDIFHTFSRNTNIVVTFENNYTFFMEVKQNNNLEIVKQCTDVEATVIGDILMKGTKQVILLKQTDLNLWQNNIAFYDISSFMPVDLYHSSVPDSCLRATISALEKKVQVGNSAIKSMESEISQKSAATIDALIKLNECKMNTESLKSSCTFQESLVDLILSNDENKIETIVTESKSSVKLLEKTHRFMGSHWIISLYFRNESEKYICYPSIKVLKRNSQLACIQKLFVHSSDDELFSNKFGREINSKMKFYIVVTLEYSVFHTEDDIFMILSWYNGSTNEFDNEIFIKEDRKILTQNQVCIQTRITLSDILNQPTERAISSSFDLLFTQALQQRTNLCVSSLHSDISKLEDILLKNDSMLNCLHLLENSPMKCIVFYSDNSLLFGVHFIIVKSTCKIVEIGAFSRNRDELCLLVHYLYQHLPTDIIILPCFKFKDECTEIIKNLAVCMKNEIDLLITSFNSHNISEEMKKSHIELMSSQTVGNITIPKSTYHRIRTVLAKKECITDSLFKSITQDV